jgi:molecular chaperone DnaK (HSP70)
VKGTAGTVVASARARTTQSIGIEILDRKAVILIGVGSLTPVARTLTFTTVADGQRAIEVRVVRCLSGRRAGTLVGRFVLAGVRPAPRGEARIDVGLSLSREGILRVWGADRSTGARQEASFSGAWALDSVGRAEALRALESLLAEEERFPEVKGLAGLAMPTMDRETVLAALAGESSCLSDSATARPLLARPGGRHAS